MSVQMQVSQIVTAAATLEEQLFSILSGAAALTSDDLQRAANFTYTLHESREVCVVGNTDGCIAAGHLQDFRHTQQL